MTRLRSSLGLLVGACLVLGACSDDSSSCPSPTASDTCDAACPQPDASADTSCSCPDACPPDAGNDGPTTADAEPDRGITDGSADTMPSDASDAGPDACTPPSLPQDLATAWNTARPYLRKYVTSGLQANNPYVLYNLQLWTNNLLMYAEHTQNQALLEQLALLELIAFDFLQSHDEYMFYYAKDSQGVVRSRIQLPLPKPAKFWTGKPQQGFTVGPESLLVSSQFLYMVARTVRVVAQMPPTARTPVLRELAAVAVPVIIEDHYMRWIHRQSGQPGVFQVKGWGCNVGTFDAKEFLDHKLHRRFGTSYFGGSYAFHKYCNAVTDTDLWLIAGTLEVIGANRADSNLVPLTQQQLSTLAGFADTGLALIQSRLSRSHPKDDQGKSHDGWQFDLGSWDDYPDYRYAGYTGSTYPGWTDPNDKTPKIPPKPSKNVGWDISHARRWVRVFDSIRRFHHLVSQPFDGDGVTKGLAEQLAWGVWNHDGKSPKFTNFMDGTNGWYRVNYSNRPGFGYPPFGLSSSAVFGGYGLWCELQPRLCTTSLEPWYRKEKPKWDLHSTSGALKEVMAAPSLQPYSLQPGGCGWTR